MAEFRRGTVGETRPQWRYNNVSYKKLFVFVSLATVVGCYLWIVFASPSPISISWTPEVMLVTTIGFGIHAGLHWLSLSIGKRLYMGLAYVLLQVGLLFALTLILHYPALLMLLFAPLLGEAISLFESAWLAFLLTLLIYGLFGYSLVLYFGGLRVWNIILEALVVSLLGMLPYLAVLILEVQSRRRADRLLNELDIAHRQLVIYAEQVEQLTLTAERSRMARELHDTLAQGVAGLILQMEALEAHLERGDTLRAGQVTSQIKSRARDVLGNSRRAIDKLRILPAHAGALVEAIRKEVEQFAVISGIECALDMPPSLILPTSITEHTLRCVSEGLANIARHARASHASVFVRLKENHVWIEIQDDGVGFDPAGMAEKGGHYGLLGLHERARLTRGTLDVESVAGQGTTLRLRIPMLANGDGST